MRIEEVRDRLLEPFPLKVHELKPGSKGSGEAAAQIFVDVREYQSRLDELFGLGGWSVSYRLLDQFVVVSALSILGVTREDVGETEDDEAPPAQGQPTKRRGAHPVFGGVAQAFRRSCAAFGLGRYLYSLGSVWAKFDGKKFTENPIDVTARAFERVGLMPRQRLESAFLRASTEYELQSVIATVKRVRSEGDLSDDDRKYLNQVMNGRRKELNLTKPDPAKAPASNPLSPPKVGLEPSDYDKIVEEQTEKSKPAFNLTPPDPDELASGGEVFDAFRSKVKSSSKLEDLDAITQAMRQEPALDEDMFARLRTMIGKKREVISASLLEASGMSSTTAKALSKATYQGIGGVPVANPHTGSLTAKQEKAQPPAPTPRAQKLLQRYALVTSFEQLKEANEAVLQEDNVTPFDQVDHTFIQEAATERHRVLTKKTDVLSKL